LFTAFMIILGTGTGIFILQRIGAKMLNTAGLFVSAGIFALFGGLMLLAPQQHWMLFILLCMLFFFLGWPNVATFVLPVIAYPQNVRATFHGISAAAAKAGAVVGAVLFPIIDHYCGKTTVMVAQAGVCAAGALLSHLCLEKEYPSEQGQGSDTDFGAAPIVLGAEGPDLSCQEMAELEMQDMRVQAAPSASSYQTRLIGGA